MHPNDYDGREYLEEIVLVQVGIISWLRHRDCVHFFQQMDVHNVRLSRGGLYYCYYWLLALTSGGVLLTADRPGQRLGASRIIGRMLALINVEFTCAGLLGHMYARFCPYHHDLQHYVDQAVGIMRVC